MRRPDFFRAASFRWPVNFAAAAIVALALYSGIIYWQANRYLTVRIDRELQRYAYRVAGKDPRAEDPLYTFFNDDPREVKIAGLFDRNGKPLAGNLQALPEGLPAPDTVGELRMTVPSARRPGPQRLRVLVRRLPNGGLLVMGRDMTAVRDMDEILSSGLLVSLIPMLLLTLGLGVLMSRTALRRIAQVHLTSRLIMGGEMSRRLPLSGTNDDFDKLAQIVNEMLDEIERLMTQAKGVGEDIAHDLRTPLTRLRGRLERGLALQPHDSDGFALLTAAIEETDHLLGTFGAILRIAEVDHGLRRAGFREVDLTDVVREAVDLYEPVAEQKSIQVRWRTESVPAVRGDGDLLFEAVANLLDNAVKFTPANGQVSVSVLRDPRGPAIRVADSGPGIRREEFPEVLSRFHRADASRYAPGTGLGLSLVASIARLHGFGLNLQNNGPGWWIELQCWEHPVMTTLPVAVAPMA